jgi:predicted lipid-binding transport protein (Tim44 family)
LSAAVFLGPVVGLAAYFWRTRATPWGGLGGGLVAGIVCGEGLAAHLTVRDTTSGVYLVAQVLVGLALLTFAGRRTSSA